MTKYLDGTGVQHLWSKIAMEDYPNNETLMAVITAIDETKADKEDLNNYLLKSDYEGSSSSGGSNTTEEWTFTLVDGSTVTKKVVIG